MITTKPHQLVDTAAFVEVTLSAAEIMSLEELYSPHPVLGYS